jgi:ABC-type uncharacterized transport system permease subunit
MLVGRYSPVGAFGAALIFGFSDQLATSLQLLRVPVPSDLLLTAPYLVTIVVVAGLIGRLRVPAADGKPYTRSDPPRRVARRADRWSRPEGRLHGCVTACPRLSSAAASRCG